MEKKGTPASPATALASSVLPVPGGAYQQHALRVCARPAPGKLLRVLEELDDLRQFFLRLIGAGDVRKSHIRLAAAEHAGAALPEAFIACEFEPWACRSMKIRMAPKMMKNGRKLSISGSQLPHLLGSLT